MSWRPRPFPSSKAKCAPSQSEMVTLHRGRGPHHARTAIIGTQEARSGPSAWLPAGTCREGQPKRNVEPRSGVGSTHSTDDAAEGNEVRRGKGPTRGRNARERRCPDTEPGNCAA